MIVTTQAIIWWDSQDPANAGWTVDSFVGCQLDNRYALDAHDRDNEAEAVAEAANLLGCDAAVVGVAHDDREYGDLRPRHREE